jgi:hypothetical protein
MKTNIIIIAISSLLLLTGCGVYEATFQEKPLNIDGSSSDWTTTLDSKDNSSYSYGISNDKQNLYIRININDQSIQRKLILGGLTVWIDTTGKKKENLGITCPTKKDFIKTDRENNLKWDNNQLLEAKFKGFSNSDEIHFLYNNPYKVEVSIDTDEFKSLYYEMKIPFQSIYSNFSDLSLKKLSIGLETGTIKRPPSGNKQSARGNRPEGMSNGGKGGNRSGGMPGNKKSVRNSAGIPNNSSMSDLTTPTRFWIKGIRLAQP